MRQTLAVLAAVGAVAVIAIATALDPEEPLAVAAMIVALALSAGSLAGVVQLSWSTDRRGRARHGDARTFRRAMEIAAICGLLLLLRVTDSLTVITGGFVVASFVAAEVILSARPGGASR